MASYRTIGCIDIVPLRDLMPSLDHLWCADTWRQTAPLSPHGDSEAIILRGPPTSRPRDILNSLDIVGHAALGLEAILETLFAVRWATGYRLARVMLVRLASGGRILPHVDTGRYTAHTQRFLLPVITSDRAWMEVDGDRRHLPVGQLTWVNKHVQHSAGNAGDVPRVHLIVDCWTHGQEWTW